VAEVMAEEKKTKKATLILGSLVLTGEVLRGQGVKVA
jgi:hypothetical protein